MGGSLELPYLDVKVTEPNILHAVDTCEKEGSHRATGDLLHPARKAGDDRRAKESVESVGARRQIDG